MITRVAGSVGDPADRKKKMRICNARCILNEYYIYDKADRKMNAKLGDAIAISNLKLSMTDPLTH